MKNKNDSIAGIAETMRTGALIDDTHCVRILETHLSNVGPSRGVLLDGFPRSLAQAELLESRRNFTAVELRLDRQVAKEKSLARRKCGTCGEDFNLASIVRDGFDMPALLPDPAACSAQRGAPCCPSLVRRDDDTADVLERRFQIHDDSIQPILQFYATRGRLATFDVLRGAGDTPALLALLSDL
jgi:adenylate kinase